jgi:hypothetical protein
MTIPRNLSNLAPGVNTSGVLGVGRGGTGATTLTGYVKGSGTSAFTASSAVPTSDLTGTLGVGNGGTGATTLTLNNVILGNGTNAVQLVAPSTNGNVLTSNGTTWVSQAPVSSGGLTLIKTANPTGITTLTVTGLSTYKQLIVLAGPINFSAFSSMSFALSSDNGSTFGSNVICSGNGNNYSFSLNIFRTNETSVFKPYYYTASSSNSESYSSVTGVINAIKFTSSSGNINSGLFVFYGAN